MGNTLVFLHALYHFPMNSLTIFAHFVTNRPHKFAFEEKKINLLIHIRLLLENFLPLRFFFSLCAWLTLGTTIEHAFASNLAPRKIIFTISHSSIFQSKFDNCIELRVLYDLRSNMRGGWEGGGQWKILVIIILFLLVLVFFLSNLRKHLCEDIFTKQCHRDNNTSYCLCITRMFFFVHPRRTNRSLAWIWQDRIEKNTRAKSSATIRSNWSKLRHNIRRVFIK